MIDIITRKHLGKMSGIFSLSTSKEKNINCEKNSKIEGSICQKCYVDKYFKIRPSLKEKMNYNFDLLTTRLLTKLEIIRLNLDNCKYFRFEAYGDLNNEIQLINYLNIAKYYKTTQFALWTKNFKIVYDYLKKGGKWYKNINLVLSGMIINKSFNDNLLNIFKKYCGVNNVISFIVTDNKNDPKINCGGKKCLQCLNCYKKGKKENVIELLK